MEISLSSMEMPSRRQDGVLLGPSSYFCKHPPRQYADDEAYRLTEAFIKNENS